MNKIITTLDKIEIGSACKLISHISKNLKLRFHLLNLGLTPGENVEILYKSPSKETTAYRVKSTTVALRHEDAENIVVEIL